MAASKKISVEDLTAEIAETMTVPEGMDLDAEYCLKMIFAGWIIEATGRRPTIKKRCPDTWGKATVKSWATRQAKDYVCAHFNAPGCEGESEEECQELYGLKEKLSHECALCGDKKHAYMDIDDGMWMCPVYREFVAHGLPVDNELEFYASFEYNAEKLNAVAKEHGLSPMRGVPRPGKPWESWGAR